MDLKEADLLGEDAALHWYYRSKADAMARLISGVDHPRRVLDVGAGSGFFTRYLLERGMAESGLCVDTGYPADRDELHADRTLSFRRSVEHDEADLVLMMDVLEHVDDDAGMLALYASKVPANATFLLTVPAHQWLWSGHDVFLEHRRRYDIQQVERLAACAGLRVLQTNYYFGAVMPIAACLRWVRRLAPNGAQAPKSQLVRHGPATNMILGSLCRAELPFMRANRLAGLSVFCLARKAG